MAGATLSDLFPVLELFAQILRLSFLQDLVDHTACQPTAYGLHERQVGGLSIGGYMVAPLQAVYKSNSRVLQPSNPVLVPLGDTVSVCRITIIKNRKDYRLYDP